MDPELLRRARSLPISGSAEAATAAAAGGEGVEGEGRRHAAGKEGGKEGRVGESEGRRGDDHPEWRGGGEGGAHELSKGSHQKSSGRRNAR